MRIAMSALFSASLLTGAAQAADIRTTSAPVRALAPSMQGPMSGFYFGTRNGVSVANDTRFLRGTFAVGNRYDVGFVNGLNLGFNFGQIAPGIGARVEAELGRQQFSIQQHRVAGIFAEKIDSFGELRAWTGFVNGFVDLNFGRMTGGRDDFMSRITPFVGAGVGFASVNFRRQGVSASGVIMDNEVTRFAAQGSAGVGIEVFERTTLEVGYRFTIVPDIELTGRDGVRSKTALISNAVTFGIRRQF